MLKQTLSSFPRWLRQILQKHNSSLQRRFLKVSMETQVATVVEARGLKHPCLELRHL